MEPPVPPLARLLIVNVVPVVPDGLRGYQTTARRVLVMCICIAPGECVAQAIAARTSSAKAAAASAMTCVQRSPGFASG